MNARAPWLTATTTTTQRAPLGFDLAGACAVLHACLQAHEQENLAVNTAQVSMRAAADMLADWADSPIGMAPGNPGTWLMYGTSLVDLAEASLWARMSAACCKTEGRPMLTDDHEALTMRRALDYLQRAAAAADLAAAAGVSTCPA